MKKIKLTFISFLVASGSLLAQTRIVGGTSTQIDKVPYQVSIQNNDGHFCGGTIINNKWILTAAHCLPGETAENLTIWAGLTDLTDANQAQELKVKALYSHPKYNDVTNDNDIALIELKDLIVYNSNVSEAILHDSTNFNLTAGTLAKVSGWGDTLSEQGSPDVIREVDVEIVAFDLANGTDSYNGKLTKNMLAAGFKAGGKDACQGDSGGPLVVTKNGKHIVVGVVSWGEGCGDPNLYGIYAKVSNYYNWIEKVKNGFPLAIIDGDDYVVNSDDVIFHNKSLNFQSVTKWVVTLPNKTTKEFTNLDSIVYTPTVNGIYSVQITVANDKGSDTFYKEFSVVSKGICDTYQLPEIKNFTSPIYNDLNIASSKNVTGVSTGFTLEEGGLFELKGISVMFSDFLYNADNESEIEIYVTDLSSNTLAGEYFPISDLTKKTDGTVEFNFSESSLITVNDIFVDVYFEDSYYSDENLSVATYSLNGEESPAGFYDEDFSIEYFDDYEINQDLVIGLIGCTYEGDRILANDALIKENSNILYPNPASDIIYINQGIGTFSLYDLEGRLILLENTSNSDNSIDISNLNSGIYFYKSTTSGNATEGKLFVK